MEDLEALLPMLRRQIQVPSLSYRTINSEEYMCEVPAGAANRAPADWQRMPSASKALVRFRPPEVTRLLARLQQEREAMAACAEQAWAAFLIEVFDLLRAMSRSKLILGASAPRWPA